MFTCFGAKHQIQCDGVSRRDFIRAGALGMGGLTLADLLRMRAQGSASPKAASKSVIMIYLFGGPSHIDMYDMKPDAPAEVRGEFKPIQTNVPGFNICELMPLQARIADKLAVVRNLKMATSGHNYQEPSCGFIYRLGQARVGNPRPAFGSVISRLRGNRGMPPFVSLGLSVKSPGFADTVESPEYLGLAHRPFIPDGPGMQNLSLSKGVTLDQMGERKQLLNTFDTLRRDVDARGEMAGLDSFNARALEIISSPQVRDAFDIGKEPDRVRARYGLTGDLRSGSADYGAWKQFLMARRLVEAGVSVVSMRIFGWDDHESIFPNYRRKLPVVDRGLYGLVTDLYERGLDKDVAVVMWGEFGRTPKVSSYMGRPVGRDHYGPANFAFFASGLRMGQAIGATDAWGSQPKGTPYRAQNVMATLYQFLGIDLETTIPDNTGRPIYLLDDRQPIAELV